MHECPITKLENYREKVFTMLPNLFALDGFDKEGNEYNSEEEDGIYNSYFRGRWRARWI
jgi:hypothetical protein